ncbi:hypothetical protein AcW1_008179 [Taiwanofungus camphoratus]|nr:hypothetical protein AcW1_008179 [Antrodia cinnamomea]
MSVTPEADEKPVCEPLPPPPHIASKLASPPPELELSAAQQTLFDEVLEHFQAETYVLPGVEGGGGLREEEKFWLSCECILRYLRATKWAGARAAIKRLEETLVWRREFGLYDLLTASHVEPEALTGKMVLFGYDADGRPAMYLRPSRQNTEETVRQMHFLTWLLERAVDLMGPGVECVLCLPSSVRPRLTLGRWPCAGLSRSWSISRTRRRTPPSPSRARASTSSKTTVSVPYLPRRSHAHARLLCTLPHRRSRAPGPRAHRERAVPAQRLLQSDHALRRPRHAPQDAVQPVLRPRRPLRAAHAGARVGRRAGVRVRARSVLARAAAHVPRQAGEDARGVEGERCQGRPEGVGSQMCSGERENRHGECRTCKGPLRGNW